MEDETTLAGHPSTVRTFLLGLLDAVKAPANAELKTLQQMSSAAPTTGTLEAWDQQFYRQQATVGLLQAMLQPLTQHCTEAVCQAHQATT